MAIKGGVSGSVMDEKALGKRLQLARKRAGLTQQELCQKAGLSYSTLAKIERGAIRTPSVFTVAHIAAATGTPLEDLLDMEPQLPGASSPVSTKKRSKTGVTFVYFDINDTLVHFHHRAFGELAKVCGQPPDMIETLYWRHHDQAATGQTSIEEFNSTLARELGIDNLDWRQYYMASVEPMPGVKELVEWAAEHYEIGLLSNNLPGIVDELRQRHIVPDVKYTAVVDSSKVGSLKPSTEIFEKAQQLAGVEAKEILLIDNDRPNLITADRVGWQGIWFDDLDPQGSITRTKDALAF
jgi:HAD superfamily hydrolase (TIGR01509 family)